MGGSRFDLENAKLPELLPYQNSFYENNHEAEIQALAIALFKEHIAPTLFDVNVLGNPHLGSIDLVRRSVNADGLALLSGEGEAEETRFLYRAWKGRNRNGRGLQFFRTYMQMLYPNAWRVNQLYQDQALPYGLGMLTESELSGRYGVASRGDELVLTSRVRVSIDYNAPLATSFSEMRKILQSVLPARLTPEFSTKIDVCSDGLGMGSDTIGIAHIIDVPTPFHCGMSARSAITQTQFILKTDSPAYLGASVSCHAPEFSTGHFTVRLDPMPFDSWANWADFVAPVFGSSAISQASVVGSVIVRPDPMPFAAAAAIGQSSAVGSVIVRPDPMPFAAAAAIGQSSVVGSVTVRLDPMPFDSWVNWADFVAPVFGSSAISQASVVGSVIVRPDPMPFAAAAAIGQSSVVGSVTVRLDPMPSDSWANWADFVAPVFGSSAISQASVVGSVIVRPDPMPFAAAAAIGQSSVVGSVTVRLDPMPFAAAAAIGQSSVVGSVTVRLDPMPSDSWANWADFVAPVFGSSAISQASVVGSVIVRPDPMPFAAAAAIGQSSVVGSVTVRLDPMPSDSWANWADFVAPVDEGTVDDFYIGLVSGYASKNLPKWSHGSDSTTSVVQLITKGILPF